MHENATRNGFLLCVRTWALDFQAQVCMLFTIQDLQTISNELPPAQPKSHTLLNVVDLNMLLINLGKNQALSKVQDLDNFETLKK